MQRVAIVTGAGSGIGRALAAALVARGVHVVVSDRDGAAAAAVAAALGERAEARAVDVTDAEAVRALVDHAFSAHGRLDYLFNNAGVGLAGEVRDLTVHDWRPVIDVNLWGTIHGVAAAYPRMIAQGSGIIVNTASGAGLAPRPGMAPYAAAKSAVVALSVSLRAEAAAYGVQVNVACPGNVATGIFASTRFVGVDGQALLGRVPFAPITPETCARRILRGVERDRAIIIDSAYVRLERLVYGLSPELAMRIAALRVRAFRDARVAP